MLRVAMLSFVVVFGCCVDRPLSLGDPAFQPPPDLGTSPDAAVDMCSPDLNWPNSPSELLRLVAPLSTSTVTNHHPTFQWVGGTAKATLDVCHDRSCTQVISSLIGTNRHARLGTSLAPGVVFWRVRDGATSSATWELFVGSRDSALDNSYGTTLDVNGDGFADVGVGQLGDGSSPGVAYVFLGGLGGLSDTRVTTLPCGESYPDWFACWMVAGAGDLDGDGFGDFVVSSIPFIAAPSLRAGTVHVYYGDPLGITPQRTASLTSPTTGDQFGRTIGGAGDVNGDGYGDLLVTAISNDASLYEWYIFFGGPSGVSLGPDRFAAIANLSRNTGESSAVGDINGDGYGDVVIFDDSPANYRGQLLVYLGGPGGLSNPAVLDSPEVTEFGFYMTIADLNGDGYADIVARGSSQSQVAYVFFGDAAGPREQPTMLVMPIGTNSLAFAGDVDGDGRDDLLMGADSRQSPLFLYRSGPGTTQRLDVTGGTSYSTAGVGDTDRNGSEDLVAGNFGKVLLLMSSDGGVDIELAVPDGGATFGYSVAGRR